MNPNLVALLYLVSGVLFIMALCFLTLLSTMLLRGKVLVGEGEASNLDYSFGIGSCVLVALVWSLGSSLCLLQQAGKNKP